MKKGKIYVYSWSFVSGDLTVYWSDGQETFQRFYGQGGRTWPVGLADFSGYPEVRGDSEEGWTVNGQPAR